MAEYVRIESVSDETGESVGGFVHVLHVMLCVLLGLHPTDPMERIYERLVETGNMKAKIVYNLAGVLTNIPIPDIYSQDKINHVCFYTLDGLYDYVEYFKILGELHNDWNTGYHLNYRVMEIPSEEILYEDFFQIVITKKAYEQRKGDCVEFCEIEFIDDLFMW